MYNILILISGAVILFLGSRNATVRRKAKKVHTLFRLVRTQHKNILKIVWVMTKILTKAMYVSLWQYMNNTVRQVDKNTFEITYVVGGNLYKMLVKVKRGPRKIIYCGDDMFNDLTNEVCSYFGPNEDFHGYEFTPHFFDTNSLTFHLSNGDEKTFTNDERITL